MTGPAAKDAITIMSQCVLTFGCVAVGVSVGMADDAGTKIGAPNAILHSLLQSKQIPEELKMSPDQIRSGVRLARTIGTKYDVMFASINTLDDDERIRQQQELVKPIQVEWEQSLNEILRPDQVRRFRQIELQLRGYFAFEERIVREAVGFSDDQERQIDMVIKEYDRQKRERPTDARPESPDPLRETTLKRLGEIMTKSQRSRWSELVGSPFELR